MPNNEGNKTFSLRKIQENLLELCQVEQGN